MQSPPSPFIIGSATLTVAAMASAASAALPPALRMSRPTMAASGVLEHAIAVLAKTGARSALKARMQVRRLLREEHVAARKFLEDLRVLAEIGREHVERIAGDPLRK